MRTRFTKKIKITLFGVLSIIILLVVIYIMWRFNQPCSPPEKPKIVPKQAIWSGGCDGGEWIELVEIKQDKYRFKVYRDWDGELMFDADFMFKDKKTKLDSINWKNLICCYNHSTEDSLTLLNVTKIEEGEETYYQLKSIYPAYGGSDWKIIKEKYKIQINQSLLNNNQSITP